MMDARITSWIRELKRFNPQLHLMGPSMLEGIEGEVEVMLPLLESIHEMQIADLGSGSGLPAIPFKILHPQTEVFFIERSTKKCTFLTHVVEILELTGVKILSQDPLQVDTLRFDAVLARSFSPISTLEKVCRKTLRDGGRLYYLFTGKQPLLGEAFRLDDIMSEESRGHRINLAVFTRLP